MEIGLIVYESLDIVSGGYMYDRHLVRALRERGHQVRVYALPRTSYARHMTHNITPSLYKSLVQAPVQLWLQDELNHPSLFLVNRALRRRVPVVSIVHHLRLDEDAPRGLRLLYRYVERAYLRTVHGFIFNSRTTRQRVHRVLGYSPPGQVAYPGADHLWEDMPTPPNPPISPEAIRTRAHAPGPLRVLFIGNVIPRKRLDTLILALRHMPAKTATVDVVGRTDVHPRYTERIRHLLHRHDLVEDVHFHGYLPPAALRSLLERSHVLVIPSQYEGFGIAYLEGMAYGLPAIAGHRGAAAEIISPGENGFLVSPDDPRPLAEYLHYLHRQRHVLAEMGIAALERYRRHPTWEESMSQASTWLETFVRTGEGLL